MYSPRFHHFLVRLRRSALFRGRLHLLAPVSLLLVVLFFSVSFFLSSQSRGESFGTVSVSPFQALLRSIGIASDDELGLHGESDQITLEEGENDPSLGIEKRTVRKGDTIYSILIAAGLSPTEVHQLTSQLKGNNTIKGFRAGRSYEIESDRKGRFIRFSWQSSPSVTIHLVRDINNRILKVNQETIAFDTRIATLEGTLSTSLAKELRSRNRGSLNPQLTRILSSRLDFRKDIHSGATYRILCQEHWNGKSFIGTGDILAVEIRSKGRRFNAYQYTDNKGNTAYYDEKGRAMIQGRTLFIQPCRYRHVSSGFGYRVHPITRQRQFHGGVDLTAPVGTPVRAVADGRITYRGRDGSAGNMVTITHGNGLHTMYLHLNRFSPATRYGKMIQQGDIIGYVGSTGRSTGSHLDFRIVRNGRPQNPLTALTLKAPQKALSASELSGFTARMARYRQQLGGAQQVIVADTERAVDPML
ncbi:MAG: peptidoglycan DD-metalloendopeptidase family protein [Chlorobiaceae bacterium]|nr:peptidoglycan DD-metalloendopeptidase family protein [Chlorobiaceae bacterium]